MRLIFLSIIFFPFLSCERKQKPQMEVVVTQNPTGSIAVDERPVFTKDTVVDLPGVVMTVPMGWRRANDDTIPQPGDATWRFRLHNQNNKLIYFVRGLGGYDKSTDFYVVRLAKRDFYIIHGIDTANVVFSDDPHLFTTLKNKIQKTHSELISGYLAKVFEPVKFGIGYSGVYIDSIGDIAGNIATFTAYSENLDELEHLELLNAIRTIKLKPFR